MLTSNFFTHALVEKFIFRWLVDGTAFILFLPTKTSTIMVVVQGLVHATTEKVMVTTSCTILLVNPYKVVGIGHNLSSSIPIFLKASQYKTFVVIPLSIKILWFVQLAMSMDYQSIVMGV